LQDPEGALTDYQIVLLLDTTYREAAFNKAKLRYHLQQYERSIEDFKKVLSMGSSGTQALYFKGTQLNKEGDVGVQAITTTHGMDADIQNYIGLCYQALNDNLSAIKSFTEALLLDREEANYYVNRGLSYVSLGEPNRAISDFKAALLLDPDHAIAQFNLTQEMEKSGRLEISVYDDLIENNPEFSAAYVNRALVRLGSGDIEGAILDYDEAIRIDPHDPVLYLNRGLAWEKAGQLNKSLADFNHALKLDASSAVAYRSRGRILFGMDRYELALSDMNDAIELEPNHAATYFNRALIHRKAGNLTQACADLDQALDLGMNEAQNARKAYCGDVSLN
jgi:tetratricopeptide (TPR) repeat protein